jgi:hypothetical protein
MLLKQHCGTILVTVSLKIYNMRKRSIALSIYFKMACLVPVSNMKILALMLSVLFTLTQTTLTGQSFPQTMDNPAWIVGSSDYWAGNCQAYHWKYGNSIAICGKPYIEAVECDYNNTNCIVKGYIRIDLERVYIRKTSLCSENDKLLYDFSLAPNSVYKMGYNLGSYDSTGAQVTATQTINYLGIGRLTQSVTYTIDPPANNYTDFMFNIRGIGSDIHPFYPLVCFGDFCETNLQLMEYRENTVLLYSKQPVFPVACNSWVGIKENSRGMHVQLFPNPSTESLHIKSEHRIAKILVTDCLGRTSIVLTPFSHDLLMDLSVLETGVYTLQLYFDNTIDAWKQKIVKVD